MSLPLAKHLVFTVGKEALSKVSCQEGLVFLLPVKMPASHIIVLGFDIKLQLLLAVNEFWE